MFARKHLFLVEVTQVVGNSLPGLAQRLVSGLIEASLTVTGQRKRPLFSGALVLRPH